MKFTIKLLLILVVSSLSLSLGVERTMLDLIETKPTKEMFKLWHYALQKPYDLNSEVALQKYKVFKANIKFIKETNEKKLSYQLGLGPFTDLTWEEFKDSYLMKDEVVAEYEKERKRNLKGISFDELADQDEEAEDSSSSDWNVKQVIDITPDIERQITDWTNLYSNIEVKNQGSCGSCWAFSAIGALEGICKLETGNVLDLSEQDVADCDTMSSACNGGMPDKAMFYIKKKGVASEADYPYSLYKETEIYKPVCKTEIKKSVTIKDFESKGIYSMFGSNRYYLDTLRDIVPANKKGPTSVVLEVKHGLEHYKQGDWVHGYCTRINHAVVAVHLTNKHYKIRNSWGRFWGEYGYGYVSRKHPGSIRACGLEEYFAQPNGCNAKKDC